MSATFDPTAEFDSAMAAFDRAEQACALTVYDVALRADIAELIEAVPLRERRRAWAQVADDCGVDPRHGWYLFSATVTTEGALLDYFTDRDARPSASAVLREAV